MNNVDLYIDFLEDKLDPKGLQEFAKNFAIDDDFRNEFKNYINLTNALKDITEYYTPTIESKNAIYSAIGFSNLIETETTPVPKKLGFFKGKYFTILATSVVWLLLGFIGYAIYGSASNNKKASTPESFISEKIKTQNEITIPTTIDKRKISKVQVGTNNKNDSKSNQILETRDTSIAENLDVFETKSTPSALKIVEENPKVLKINTENGYTPKENNFQIALYDTCMFIRRYDTRVRFEFKNTPSWFTNTATIQPFQFNKFNNLSVSVFYPVYKTLILGADFRQETFYLEYTGINNQDQHLRYYQQPNLSTFGLSLRYTPFDLSEHFKPFGQLLIGANKYGFITREMIGLEYYPFEYVYFLFGAELNQFYFSHSSNWFNASKYSLNYGIGVKF